VTVGTSALRGPAPMCHLSHSARWFEHAGGRTEPALRLFTFPYAGGSCLAYSHWRGAFPEQVGVSAVQLPGRGSRISEEPFCRLDAVVDALCGEILPYLDRPFAFFGHSMGGLIAYELACRLRQERLGEPSLLMVSGTRPPHLRWSPATYDLPDDEFIETLRQLNGMPDEILCNPDAMELLLPVLRADFEVCQTRECVERPPLHCPIVAFCGDADEHAGSSTLQQWRRYTGTRFELHLIPGDHFFIRSHELDLLPLVREHLMSLLQPA